LPLRPMMPRLSDKRVGFFEVRQTDFGTTQHRSVSRSYITRWRLEKKFPDSALSDPVKPIVYYIDPATPSQWVPWIKKGVEDWQPAFEAAGFRRAIVAIDAPSRTDNPDWSPEDVRNTVVRWLPSTVENADAPHVHDPRSGEILNGSIRMHHNVLNLLRNWYVTQVAPLDSRAQRLPLPDSLMGRLIEYIVAHEVGHTLGLQHNMKASSTYPADSIRSITWLRRMGHTPTLMDYSRFNYVAQPEDSIPPEYLIPRVGPYDKFATRWGYSPIRGAYTPDDEKPTLNSWARQQDSVPWFRFSTYGSREIDPGDEAEAVGDADAIKSTALGLRNISRTMPILMSAALRDGEDNSELIELHDRLLEQWNSEMEHVVNVIGGSYSREKYGGQAGPRFVPVPADRQRAALRFLTKNAFRTPGYLIDPSMLRRIEPEGTLRRISSAQGRILSGLLDADRLNRLAEYEALARGHTDVYPLGQMLGDIRRAVWSELPSREVRIDPFRRALQRSWLGLADSRLNSAPALLITPTPTRAPRARISSGPNTDVRALMRGELIELDRQLAASIPRAGDRTTRLHLIDARSEIERILDSKK
ncbi:MAG TPA: zinc-dependent metalloprotease, partial [Gemmatimonadaceae bacterium]|nr:zinc-dependent metalloprotease [Gemmatimonadaceae bacterium]